MRARRSIRLPDHDYASESAYFITLVTYQREELFGEISEGVMRLNEFGRIVQDEWERSIELRDEIKLDAFQLMPNHLHGIVIFQTPNLGKNRSDAERAHGHAPLHIDDLRKPRSLGSFVAGLKSSVTVKINVSRGMPGTPVWQRNYYERIVRDERELHTLRRYIVNNPRHWDNDDENPRNLPPRN